MVTFSTIDIAIIVIFFIIVLLIGYFSNTKKNKSKEDYLLSNRKIGLFLFVLTNVATWYGGILGVGEFTYNYGLLSWFTQGLPYYLFAIIFAVLLAGKIREAKLISIPDKLGLIYGSKVRTLSSIIIFLLVSPAPYMLMLGSLLHLIFGLNIFICLVFTGIFPILYLFKSGYKADVLTDSFEFFMMFIGFGIILYFSLTNLGGIEFLKANLPENHLKFSGGQSPVYIFVWFMIALWTFTDPGFHQRTNAAKNAKTAKWGIIISVAFWILFDFLTTSTGLYARATINDITNPVLSFPIYAEKILSSGFKGVFYAALFATILSTYNSMIFLSATTFGNDIIPSFFNKLKFETKTLTRIGIILSIIISIIISSLFTSVIEIWYTIGSICIPGLILIVFGAYFERIRISKEIAFWEIIISLIVSLSWFVIRANVNLNEFWVQIEPMNIGLLSAIIIHIFGIKKRRLGD